LFFSFLYLLSSYTARVCASCETILERVQRRATRWILRTRIGEMSYKQRLLTLDLLPLTYERELRDLVFLYNCIFGYTDLNIGRYVSFITHGRYRSKNPNLILKPAYCKTTTFQASFCAECIIGMVWGLTSLKRYGTMAIRHYGTMAIRC